MCSVNSLESGSFTVEPTNIKVMRLNICRHFADKLPGVWLGNMGRLAMKVRLSDGLDGVKLRSVGHLRGVRKPLLYPLSYRGTASNYTFF